MGTTEPEASRTKTVNVKGVDADLWDGLKDVKEARQEGLGAYLSGSIRIRQAVDRGALKVEGSTGSDLTEDQVTERMFAVAALIQALAAAKQAGIRPGNYKDVAWARRGIKNALHAGLPPLPAIGGPSSKAGMGLIPTAQPGGIDRYDVAEILQGTDQ
jgi:hypothetical protein